jgi:peptide/nickel transport system permease protein
MSAPVPSLPRRRFPLKRWWPIAILAVFVLTAICAPLLAPYDPNAQNLVGRLKPPGTVSRSFYYWLGSDELGRDLLSRIIYGTRVSLLVAVLSVLLSGACGTALGLIAGYRRGWVETAVMRIADVFLSIPAVLLAIITVAVLGPSLVNVVLVLALTRWPRYARVAHAQTLATTGMAYVENAVLSGGGNARILFRHILPNIAGTLIVVATLEFGLMVLFEAGLSFLGLGVQPPTASWGSMLSTGRNYVATAWWVATLPGLCLFALVLTVNLTGDAVRDRLDPHFR